MPFNVRNNLSWYSALVLLAAAPAFGGDVTGTAELTGRVIDDRGAAVVGADICVGNYRTTAGTRQKDATTDKDGGFRIPNLKPGKTSLFIFSPGKAPYLGQVAVGKTEPLEITMKPARSIRFLVVDQDGQVIEKANVQVVRWGSKGVWAPTFHTQTDSKGLAAWEEAPEMVVEYSIQSAGYAEGKANLVADGEQHKIVLYPILKVAGTVTDATTGRAIEQFQVVPVIYFTPDFPFVERSQTSAQKNGKFSFDFERTDIGHGVQIEAPGYMTRRSGRYRIGQANPTIEFQLQPAQRHRGQVLDEHGKPVSGAKVYVATGFQNLYLTDLVNEEDGSNYLVTADGKGAFEIVPQMETYSLVVASSAGYAEVKRNIGQQPGEVRVKPWARVKGKLMQAGRPVTSARVAIYPIRNEGIDEPPIHANFSATTDDMGSFEFERVPPIRCRVLGNLHWSGDYPLSSSQSVPLELNPGDEVSLNLGGNGIEVTGQLALDAQELKDFDYHFSINYLVARKPGIEPPPFISNKGFDWRKGWNDSWASSTEGFTYLATLHNYFVKPEPDGRLRISGVEPGDYELAISLYETTEGCLVHPVGSRVLRFTVEPDASDLELGKIAVPSMPVPRIGELAPGFQFVGLDGGNSSLTDMRGKYVLLDFWATWCGPCVAKLGEVERLRKEYADRAHLVVVGVNLDADKEQAQEFLRSKDLPWMHTLLGDWSSTDVPRRFAISTVPTYVLIDDQGRIIAHENSLEQVMSKLQAALGQPAKQ